jgi:GNAT superfamily N-acetyltransferase
VIRGKFWAADLTREGPPPPIHSTDFVEVGARHAEALVVAMGDEGDRVASRFARGCRAFTVLEGQQIAGYGWLSTGPEWVGEVADEISPAPGEAYVWNCVTLPDQRRRGRYRALLEGVIAQARRDGLSRLWIGSVEDPAEKANTDVGFVTVLNVEVRRLAGLRLIRGWPEPGVDPELVAAARKRLSIRTWTRLGLVRHRIH